nr:biopolymer transporter ExbD [Desulfobulbaceae bacterium]
MEESGFESINIIPLVDVMLVLLTIVLTTSTFIATGAIPVQLPKAVNSENAVTEGVIIEIDKSGTLYVEGKPAKLNKLNGLLSPLDRSTPILIRADKSIELQLFVQVMDSVKGLNFRKVSLQTEEAGS